MAEKRPFDEYIMVAPGSDYGLAMWADLKQLPNCTFYDYVLRTQSKILKLFHHVHFSFALNKWTEMPLHGIWNGVLSINPNDIDPNKQYCIIFTDVSACRVGKGFLEQLHNLKNVTLVLVLVNIIAAKKRIILDRLKYFSLCFSFDKADCIKYGFTYHPTFYSKIRNNTNVIPETDAFFVGVAKGERYQKLIQLQKIMEANGLKTDFYIAKIKNSEKQQSSIHHNEWLDYGEILDKVKKTRCIVEIMGGNQEGLTLRAMEAVCYNKLLLTDNASVRDLKYYETGFIHYFKDIEAVDLSFLNTNTQVDYHYDGDFSPVHLITHINEIV